MDPAVSLDIFTDGACLGNPGPGGWAAILRHPEKTRELSGGFSLTTNNRMEIMAVVQALEALTRPCDVALYTDSQYVVKAVEQRWLANWQRNGWKSAAKKAVKNQDLWQRLLPLLQEHRVRFHWLKGHAGHPENERCDELARAEALCPGQARDPGFE